MHKPNLVVFTGAGTSEESGIKTFRDAGGLWENHDLMEVASITGWVKNPSLVLEFYNQRRRQLHEVRPNKAHYFLAHAEDCYRIFIITQNVDNLHEEAGSTKVVHLHGELFKARSTGPDQSIIPWINDIILGDTDDHGYQLRPHIVWFGEEVPMFETAINITLKAEAFLVIGTSLAVYPAASLLDYVPSTVPIWYVDPSPSKPNRSNLNIIKAKASSGVEQALNEIAQFFTKRY